MKGGALGIELVGRGTFSVNHSGGLSREVYHAATFPPTVEVNTQSTTSRLEAEGGILATNMNLRQTAPFTRRSESLIVSRRI